MHRQALAISSYSIRKRDRISNANVRSRKSEPLNVIILPLGWDFSKLFFWSSPRVLNVPMYLESLVLECSRQLAAHHFLHHAQRGLNLSTIFFFVLRQWPNSRPPSPLSYRWARDHGRKLSLRCRIFRPSPIPFFEVSSLISSDKLRGDRSNDRRQPQLCIGLDFVQQLLTCLPQARKMKRRREASPHWLWMTFHYELPLSIDYWDKVRGFPSGSV